VRRREVEVAAWQQELARINTLNQQQQAGNSFSSCDKFRTLMDFMYGITVLLLEI
jgi:hypothetical protein